VSYDVAALLRSSGLRDPHGVARALRLEVAKGTSSSARTIRVLCPWHSERSASCGLTVRDGRLVAHCQACKQGGDVLSLIAAVEGLDPRRDFRACVARAAEIAGVELEERSGRAPRQPPPPPKTVEEKLREARVEVSTLRRELDHVREVLHDEAAQTKAERIVMLGALERIVDALVVFDAACQRGDARGAVVDLRRAFRRMGGATAPVSRKAAG
jgi:CHC2 zinc finger